MKNQSVCDVLIRVNEFSKSMFPMFNVSNKLSAKKIYNKNCLVLKKHRLLSHV